MISKHGYAASLECITEAKSPHLSPAQAPRFFWNLHHGSCCCSLFADSEFFGAAMGISESFLSLGWIIGPLLGGYAADVAGFAAPFVLTAVLAFLSVPLLLFLMPPGEPAAYDTIVMRDQYM